MTLSVEEAIRRRRSVRSGGPLTLAQLARVLHLSSMSPPSAGGFRTIQPYVAIGEVEGAEPGIWHYRREDANLLRVEGLEAADSALSRASGAMGSDTCPPAVILLRADWGRLRGKYGANAFALATREAGIWLGLLSLAAVASDAGGCCLGPAGWGEEDMAAFALWG